MFNIVIEQGESLAQWTGRANQIFMRSKTKADVTIPEQAKGWLLLHRCGLAEDQKAVIKAKTTGSHDFAAIESALRSCYPSYKAAKQRRPEAVFATEPEVDTSEFQEEFNLEGTADGFEDLEAFITENGTDAMDEIYAEDEMREVLAVSWKDKRSEINKAKLARNFKQVSEIKRSFRVDVEELKRRTKCNNCGKIGHWARECRAPKRPKDAPKPDTTVTFIETFVGATDVYEVLLTTSPGMGLADSGCGKSVIGESTLARYATEIQNKHGLNIKYETQANNFRFGNNTTVKSTQVAWIPVGIGGHNGSLAVAVISGDAPLLLSKPCLQGFGGILDFEKKQILFTKLQCTVDLLEAESSHFLLNLMDLAYLEPVAVLATTEKADLPGPDLAMWARTDKGCRAFRATSLDGPPWSTVTARTTIDSNTGEKLEAYVLVKNLTGRELHAPLGMTRDLTTTLHYRPNFIEDENDCISLQQVGVLAIEKHKDGIMQRRYKRSIAKECQDVSSNSLSTPTSKSRPLLCELFSPCRVNAELLRRGHTTGTSYDIKTGM